MWPSFGKIRAEDSNSSRSYMAGTRRGLLARTNSPNSIINTAHTKNNGVPSLILSGGGDMFHVSQMIEERANVRRTQFPMELQEPPRPQHARFLRAQRVMFDSQKTRATDREQFAL